MRTIARALLAIAILWASGASGNTLPWDARAEHAQFIRYLVAKARPAQFQGPTQGPTYDPSGYLYVNVAAGGGGGGSVTQGTSPWVVSLTSTTITGSVAVTGTFWQATQPVSGTFWQTTQPVSGTFWQTTQPVSIASMPSTPVTGTFWQATQPVSIVDGSLVTLGAKADAKSTATDTTAITIMQVLKQMSYMLQNPASTPVTGSFYQSTQPVSIADGSLATLGAKADAKSTATDTTAISIMQVLKELSFMAQTPAALPANQSVNLSQLNAHTTLEGGVNGALATGGCVATNTATPCNPMNLGAQAVSSENSAATTAREVQLVSDLVGKLIVLPYANPENFVSGVTGVITDTTSTSLIASAGGSLRDYITSWSCTNSHATVGTFIKLLDNASIKAEMYAAPAGGGFSVTMPNPLVGTAATAWNVQAVTTGANFICNATGYKGL